MRELHWHPNADEWQYYIAGRARMGVFGSQRPVRTEEFAAGDVGYVPQGYGHYIENTGTEELEVLVVLNSGDYQSISLTAWMAANPPALLATNFGVPAIDLRRLSDRCAHHRWLSEKRAPAGPAGARLACLAKKSGLQRLQHTLRRERQVAQPLAGEPVERRWRWRPR